MKIKAIIISVVILAAIIAVFRPVPIVAESECEVVSGIVTKIYEGGEKDAVFLIQGDKTRYYINRGLENGLTLDGLRAELIQESVTFKYPRYWTPLDPKKTIRHVSKVEIGEKVIFDETKK